jgi:CheY-like chemotaxis protein
LADAFAPPGFDARFGGVCIHRKGKVLYLGHGLPRLLGLSGVETMVGSELLELVSPSDRPEVDRAMNSAARDGRSAPTKATFCAPGGTSTHVEFVALSFEWAGPAVEALYVRACESVKEDRVYMDSRQGEDTRREADQPTVLICDDEARLGALTAGLLSDFGFRPVTVGTGGDAIERLTSSEPAIDVVLLDVHLVHGQSAKEVLLAMRANGSKARVVLTSGLAAEDVETALMTDPYVAGYIAKPYAVEALVAVIREALGRRSH